MKELIKNLFYRIKINKAYLITYLILMPMFIFFAVYFTNSISYQMQIGLIGDVKLNIEDQNINLISLDEIPKDSEFLLNKYDVVIKYENETYEIISVKGEDYEQQIMNYLQGNIVESKEVTRGAASNILGFLMMIIGLLGVQLYLFYFEERKGVNKRIMSTSINFPKYMLSHFLVTFLFLFLPAMIIICSAIFIFNIDILISIPSLIFVIFLLTFFSSAFGLWMNSVSKTQETAMSFGNMFAIIGSIICGGFIAVTDNKIFNNITNFFPQKQIMLLLENLENNLPINIFGIIFILVLSLFLILMAIIIEKKMISKR